MPKGWRGTPSASPSAAATTWWSPRSRRCGSTWSASSSTPSSATSAGSAPALSATASFGGSGRDGTAPWAVAARVAGKPVWRLLADMTPEQLVRLVDFRYLEDALTPAEALDILRAGREGRDERIAELEAVGHPAYTTTPGWIGYSDEKLVALSQQAVADGFKQIKLKVGADTREDKRRR